MPPDIIATYRKDLSITPFGCKSHLETYYFFTRDGGLFRVNEYLVSEGEYDYYLEIFSVGCSTPDYYIEHGCQLDDEKTSQQVIVDCLLGLEMEDETTTEIVGRVAYNEFTFVENGGGLTAAKQIKSVMILSDFRGAGLARHLYRKLTEKYDHVVCDNTQSIDGGALWASGIQSIAEVRIYDTITKKFIEVLGRGGCGINGYLPWSCQTLTIEEIVKWGRDYSDVSCHHIVNIISRATLYDD